MAYCCNAYGVFSEIVTEHLFIDPYLLELFSSIAMDGLPKHLGHYHQIPSMGPDWFAGIFSEFFEHVSLFFAESSSKASSHPRWEHPDELIHRHGVEFFNGFSSVVKVLGHIVHLSETGVLNP